MEGARWVEQVQTVDTILAVKSANQTARQSSKFLRPWFPVSDATRLGSVIVSTGGRGRGSSGRCSVSAKKTLTRHQGAGLLSLQIFPGNRADAAANACHPALDQAPPRRLKQTPGNLR